MSILEILNRKCPFTHRRFGSDNYREPKITLAKFVHKGGLGALTNLAHRFAEILYLHKNAGAPAFLCNYRGTSPCTVILRKPRSPKETSGDRGTPCSRSPSSPRNALFKAPESLLGDLGDLGSPRNPVREPPQPRGPTRGEAGSARGCKPLAFAKGATPSRGSPGVRSPTW